MKINRRLTMRSVDRWVRAAFLGIFLALGLSRFDGEFTLPPATNARHWAFRSKSNNRTGSYQVDSASHACNQFILVKVCLHNFVEGENLCSAMMKKKYLD